MPRFRYLWLSVALAAAGAPAQAAPQSDAQQKCIREIHKRLGAVAKAQGRLGAHCLKDISRGDLVGLGWRGCSEADAPGKVAKTAARTEASRERKCAGDAAPTELLSLPDAAAVDAANEGVRAAVLGLGDDLLSRPASIVRIAGDKPAAKCQAELLKRAHKLLDIAWKESMAGVQDALEAGAADAAEVAAALVVGIDASSKLAKAEAQLVAKAEKKCADVSPPLVFRGVCTAATAAEVAECAAERVRCRLCLALTDLEDLPLDCDSFDDGTVNLSCSPFL